RKPTRAPSATLFPYTTLFRSARRRKSLRAPGCQLKSSTATSYERGEKQNANFKSNNDHGRFGGRLKLGRVCSKKGDDSHGNNGQIGRATSELQSPCNLVCRLP